MPANLPPQYFETEKKLKSAKTPEDKINILEELLSIIPKHKGTEKLQAQLKTKLARFRSDSKKKATTAKHISTHSIKKSGAGQIVLVGLPNSGKSQLVKSLTNAEPVVSDYPFTTLAAFPAMMFYENIQIQLVDTPPVTPDFIEPWFPDLVKTSDAVMIILDLAVSNPFQIFQIILNLFREKKIEFITECQPDTIQIPAFPKKALVVAAKQDLPDSKTNFEIMAKFFNSPSSLIPVSAISGEGLEVLKRRIYLLLNIIRVYSKIPGKKAEMKNPFTLKRGSTVLEMAQEVHKDFSHKLKFARIWSKNKYQGQMVKRDHLLEDEDIIELHI